jgi:Domain of unknown function (DUF5615)
MPWKKLSQPSPKEEAELEVEFGKKTAFLVDESVDPAITDFLRKKGWNVKTVSDVGLAGQDDEAMLAAAHRDDRVLLTHDRDFLDDRKFPPHRNPGVAVLPEGGRDFGALSTAVHNMLILVGAHRNFYHATKVEFLADGSLILKRRRRGRDKRTRYRFTRHGPAEVWEDEQ